MWSNLQLTETQISDVYVRLGNDFNAAVAAFAAFEIDMRCVAPPPFLVQSAKYNPRDLMSIPEDLRDVLETCLAEDATPDNLAIYLPKVRAIITRLLQGLRSKQSMYRRIVSEQRPSFRHRTPPVEPADVPAVARSLAALKDDALERRAAKQFSTYHFNQMSGGPITRERTLPASPNNRRSMAVPSTLTAGDQVVLTEVDEPEGKRDGSVKWMPRAPSPAVMEVVSRTHRQPRVSERSPERAGRYRCAGRPGAIRDDEQAQLARPGAVSIDLHIEYKVASRSQAVGCRAF